MQVDIGLLFIICFTSQINQLLAENAEIVETCPENKNLEVRNSPSNSTCKRVKVRNDYTHTPGIGNHKFHTQGKTWNEARRVCYGEGGHLVIIKSKEEAKLLHSLLVKNYKNIKNSYLDNEAFVGVHSQLEHKEWLTVRNQPNSSIGYDGWSFLQPDKDISRRCAIIWRYGIGMSNQVCTTPRAFFCEIRDKCS